ncbi:MAG: YcxB family protein [Anaerolineales bacterium]|nr:YcxB family protein [Anaerolineales bacterium]
MLEITYTVKGWEWFEGLLISSLKRLFPRVGSLIFPLLFLIGLAGIIGFSDVGESIPLYAVILLAILLVLLCGVPALRAFQYSRNKLLSSPSTWKICGERIEIHSRGTETKVSWKSFGKMGESWHLFMLPSATHTQSIYFIPKRAFRDNAQRERFREMAKRAYERCFPAKTVRKE